MEDKFPRGKRSGCSKSQDDVGRSVGADGGQLSKNEEEEKQRDPRKRNGPQFRWEDSAEGWEKGGGGRQV